jgi:hypothetical protein
LKTKSVTFRRQEALSQPLNIGDKAEVKYRDGKGSVLVKEQGKGIER